MYRSNRRLFASVILLLVVGLSGCGSSVAIPSSYKSWNAKDGTFKLNYPANWEAKGGGKQGIQWASFASGKASIRVDTDVSSSLMGGIGQVGMGFGEELSEEDAMELAPVHGIHEGRKEQFAEDMRAYSEEDPIKFSSSLGEGRKSAFSSSEGMGTKIRGYRATVLSNNKGIHIVCKCPAKYWDELKPAFDEILESLEYGVAEL